MSQSKPSNISISAVEEEPYYFYIQDSAHDYASIDRSPKNFKDRDNFGTSFKIQFQLQVMEDSYLHIGSGLTYLDSYKEPKDIPSETPLDFMRTHGSEKQPFIPGSTLKGYLRYNYECLVPGCCYISNGPRDRPAACEVKRPPFSICPACDLFGVNTILARLTVSDAYLIKDNVWSEETITIPKLMGPNDRKYRPGYRKLYRLVKFNQYENSPRKPDLLRVVSPGAIFEGTITIINSDINEIRQVFHAFASLYPKHTLLLGHGKNLGLGHCRLIGATLYKKDHPFKKEQVYKIDLANINDDKIFSMKKLSSTTFRKDLLRFLWKDHAGKPYPETNRI